jgi:fumarylacetoacetate (FAA) hydrolase
VKLATVRDGTRDGRLVVVSRDLTRALDATAIAPTLLAAVESWSTSAPRLQVLYDTVNRVDMIGLVEFDSHKAAAPLPRAPQWCDGSAFLSHGALMQQAFNLPPIPDVDRIPLIYQGASDDMLGPHDDVSLPDEAHGIDFEGEFGVVVGDVPMGATARVARSRILLLVLINDVSLRSFAAREMRTGFGFVLAKPSSSFAAVAVTPDEIGDAWRDARVYLNLSVEYNGSPFGAPSGAEMQFGFDELIAHAATTRRLSAGSIIGSGTVSNAGAPNGSACIAERRAIETIRYGAARTPFMTFGDRIRMEVCWNAASVFGAIDQRVVQARPPHP